MNLHPIMIIDHVKHMQSYIPSLMVWPKKLALMVRVKSSGVPILNKLKIGTIFSDGINNQKIRYVI